MSKPLLQIIDNNEDEFLIMKRRFGRNFNFRFGDGCGDIVAQIEAAEPICVFLDYHNKNYECVDVVAAVRANKKNKDLPIVIYTSDLNPNIKTKCLSAGANRFVAKDSLSESVLDEIISLKC